MNIVSILALAFQGWTSAVLSSCAQQGNLFILFSVVQDECSFVSLRDVERVLQVMSWFFYQAQDRDSVLFIQLQHNKNRQRDFRELSGNQLTEVTHDVSLS